MTVRKANENLEKEMKKNMFFVENLRKILLGRKNLGKLTKNGQKQTETDKNLQKVHVHSRSFLKLKKYSEKTEEKV